MAYATIDKPTDYFETKLYAGNDSGQGITMDFAPNWVWLKDRGGTDPNSTYDSVRGVLQQLRININNANRELAGTVTAFNSDGFTVGNDDGTNDAGHNFVCWNWRAGTAFSNDASSTSVGTVDSVGSVNQDAGFSIVSYTNTNQTANSGVATIKHGLNKIPSVMILKDRDAASDWSVFHSAVPTNKYLRLHDNVTPVTDANIWNNTAPTSTVFTVGDNSYSNPADRKMIAYCFHSVQGYSKFGTYKGNNSNDGTFVHLGFKPAFVMVKIIDTQTDNWIIQDNKRNTTNLATSQRLRANTDGAEFSSSNEIDLLSNGFKCHGADGEHNGDGAGYIFMAWAENPFVTSTGVPATAR